MNSADQSTAFIQRVMQLQEFEVKRTLDQPLRFTGGAMPFDLRANQECAWFTVLAVSQGEAEQQVDTWLKDRE